MALVSFILAFVTARTYADSVFQPTFYSRAEFIFTISGLDLFFLQSAVGLGINYNSKGISIAAAILYGVGGGLIVDEVGLLLTFGDYWSANMG